MDHGDIGRREVEIRVDIDRVDGSEPAMLQEDLKLGRIGFRSVTALTGGAHIVTHTMRRDQESRTSNAVYLRGCPHQF